MTRTILITVVSAAVLAAEGLIVASGQQANPRPPQTRVEEVVDVMHGIRVPDPYRWLEDQNAPETRAWIDAQNAYTRAFLDAPGRREIGRLLENLPARPARRSPFASAGGRYVIAQTVGGVRGWYVRESLDGKDRLLLTPRSLFERPGGSVLFKHLSADGKQLALAVAQQGDEAPEIRFVDVDSGRVLPEKLPSGVYSDTCLLPERGGFYYAQRTSNGTRLKLHRWGNPPVSDAEIFGADFDDSWLTWFAFSRDCRYAAAFVNAGAGSAPNTRVYLMAPERTGRFEQIVPTLLGNFSGFLADDRLVLKTTAGAPNGRVIAVDVHNPTRWREIVKESSRVLIDVKPTARRIVLSSLENVTHRLEIVSISGRDRQTIPLPGLGSAGIGFAEWDSPELFFQFDSFLDPGSTFRYDVASKRRRIWFQQPVVPGLGAAEVRQIWYASKDGTRVPMFVVKRKDVALDGERPVLLSAYGGYGVVGTPGFSQEAVAWVQAGGVYAWASIRGGGEFGEAWHKDGMLGRKQNSFDDFIAAAEWLIQNKFTRPDRLGIVGGSNGGMLVAAAAVQRPELFGAVVCRNPHLDMVRYHKFLAAAPWVREFGSPDVAEEFAYLFAYSPYHRVVDGARYPAVLLSTGDLDTRVAPLHARKMTARLQAASSSGRPILLRYDAAGGHLSAGIERITDELWFLFSQLGVQLPKSSATK